MASVREPLDLCFLALPVSFTGNTSGLLIFLSDSFLDVLGDRYAVVQTAIVGENLPVAARGNGTDQHVSWANLEATIPAFVVKASRMLMIGSFGSFINKRRESRLDFFELCRFLDPRQ